MAFGGIPVDVFMHSDDVGLSERIGNGQEGRGTNLRIFEAVGKLEEPILIISTNLLRDGDLIPDLPAGQIFLRANRKQRTPTRRRCRYVRIGDLDIQCF